MRRIVLVVALMVIMVAVVLTGMAFAQALPPGIGDVPPGAGCEGLEKALEQQKTRRPGLENRAMNEVAHQHGCKSK